MRGFVSCALLVGACANLVGITDTEVEPGAGGQAGSGQPGSGGSSGTTSGGSAGTSSTGGDAGRSGSAGTGPGSGGSAGMEASAGNGAGGTSAEAGASSAGAPAGGSGSGCDCPPETPTCTTGGVCIVRGPTMVPVNNFFMDSTEVTIGQYAEFLAAKGEDTGGQPAYCAWNTKYAPEPGEITDELALPMTYVDWCDAAAFCAWADKRLCGAIGGGAIDADSVTDSAAGQWVRGCAGPNSDTHPSHGGVYDDCNDDSGYLFATGSTCQGSYDGLFDTQGNAAEWVDSCATQDGAADICLSLGGSYTGVGSDYCNETPTEWMRSDRYNPLGFRCCSK
jgi:hypothetical protein